MRRCPSLWVLSLSLPLLAQDPGKWLHTDREAGKQLLVLPKQDDAFGFVVFGDRTGGPAAGIEVLKQAVRDTNLLDPDLVMTVGDLVQGYNQDDEWQRQAAEFKAVMTGLRMPWFPVAGNHDVYWRGPAGAPRPAGEHEGNFEKTFGPLWYSFEHKRCCFVVLYSDEGDPATGKKDFNDAACQRISERQFAWLTATLQAAKAARHVFVFLHHPRWIADRYRGSDWDRVHALLRAAGNVSAVFAGHIHRMRFDGVRDGIAYYTVASVGASLEMDLPKAGFLHQFHVVTVRPEGIVVAALPVGTVVDPQQITGELSEDVERLARLRPALQGLQFAPDGSVDGIAELTVGNPARRPIELTVLPDGEGYAFTPDHAHARIEPAASATVKFAVRRGAPDGGELAPPRWELRIDYLGDGLRVQLPPQRADLSLPPPAELGLPPAAGEGALQLRSDGACLELEAARAVLPDGPLTIEAWIRPDDLAGRRGLITKTESSEYGVFVSDGRLSFLVFAGADYATAQSPGPVLESGRWQHVAGVYDGQEVRAYVDGALVGRAPASGPRRTNRLPLLVGADVDAKGQPTSPFAGRIDEVRISTVARYQGPFAPARRFEPDAATALLLHLDQDGPFWTPDAGPQRAHARRRGGARCTPLAGDDR